MEEDEDQLNDGITVEDDGKDNDNGEEKERLKATFDAEYDAGKGRRGQKGRGKNDPGEEGAVETYMDSVKREMERQAALNEEAFEDATVEEKLMHFGCAPGVYVRVEIHEVGMGGGNGID